MRRHPSVRGEFQSLTAACHCWRPRRARPQRSRQVSVPPEQRAPSQPASAAYPHHEGSRLTPCFSASGPRPSGGACCFSARHAAVTSGSSSCVPRVPAPALAGFPRLMLSDPSAEQEFRQVTLAAQGRLGTAPLGFPDLGGGSLPETQVPAFPPRHVALLPSHREDLPSLPDLNSNICREHLGAGASQHPACLLTAPRFPTETHSSVIEDSPGVTCLLHGGTEKRGDWLQPQPGCGCVIQARATRGSLQDREP